jgi:dipeptidyl aminopeptidase/acylaminoacyl peptidase
LWHYLHRDEVEAVMNSGIRMTFAGPRTVLALCWWLCSGAFLPPPAQAAEPAQPYPARSVNNGQLILQGVPEIPAQLVSRLNQYQNVRSANFVDWTEGGPGLYIVTRFSRVNQLHRVDYPGGARNQLTFFKETIGEVAKQPKGPLLALTMDRGGSELSQIFLLDPASAQVSRLTDGTSRNTRLVWDKSGARLAYQSISRNDHSNDIWLMDIRRPEAAALLLEAPDDHWWAPVDFTADGKSLLVQHYIGATDSRVYLLDLDSGARRLLAGSADDPSSNRAVIFDRADAGFYFISNARGMGAELAWQSLQPGARPEYITKSIPWDVTEFALSPDGRRGAFTTNEEGVSRLYLLDTRSRRFWLVNNMPVGVIFGLRFHSDNRRLAMTLSTAQTPSDVFVMQLGRSPATIKSLQRWTFSEVGGLDTSRFVAPRLVHYPTFDQDGEAARQIPAFVYRPDGKGPFPVIIYIHGGPESQYRPAFSNNFQMWLADLGAAVIAPNVRGSLGYGNEYLSLDDGMKREDAVKDIGALLDWIALQPELDASRVALYGGSYGGYMVLASAAQYSARLRGAVDLVGISNFVTFLENTEGYRRELRRSEYGDERDPAMRAFLQRISPLNQVASIKVPLLVVQGQNDPRVPVTEAEQIVAALRRQGNEVWYINALNEGHGYERKDNQDVYQQAVMMFLQRYLVE